MQLNNLISWLKSMGLDIHFSQGKSTTIMGLVGDTASVDIDLLNALEIVETVKRVQEPYKNANRKFHPEDTVIEIAPGIKIGGGHFQVIAGPCSVESEEQLLRELRRPVRNFTEAAHSNLELHRTLSRVWEMKESNFFSKQKKSQGFQSLQK